MKYVFGLYILLIFMAMEASVGQTINWQFPEPVHQVTAQINGFNTGGYSLGLMAEQAITSSAITSSCNCFNASMTTQGHRILSLTPTQDIVDKTARIRPGVLRFPGGTQANWYHLYAYDGQWLYDAANPTVAKGFGLDRRETYALELGVNQFCREDARLDSGQNYIDFFVDFINAIKTTPNGPSSVQVSFVANLLKHFRFLPIGSCGRNYMTLTPWADYDAHEKFEHSYSDSLFGNSGIYRFELFYKETQDAIEYIVDATGMNTSDVVFVEMGNEYYNSNGPMSAYWSMGMNAEDYADLVEIYAQRLKKYFAGEVTIKIGVTSEPNSLWQSQLRSQFDSDVDQDDTTFYDIIDAVVLHDYFKDTTCDTVAGISERFACARQVLSEFSHGAEGIIADYENLRINFPGKNIWLTEWNMVNGANGLALNYMNTPLHAAFVQETALEIFDYNLENGHVIEMATHHRLGYDRPWSVLQTADGVDTAIVRASAYVFQYLRELYDRPTTYFIGNILQDDGEPFDPSLASAKAFYQSAADSNGQDRILIYFSNKTGTEIPLTLPAMIYDKAVESGRMDYVQGDNLYSYGRSNKTNGRNYFTTISGEEYYDEALNDLGVGDIYNSISIESDLPILPDGINALPAYSVGVAIIDLQKNSDVLHTEFSKSTVQVLPNPARDNCMVLIDLQESSDISIEIINIAGVQLWANTFIGRNGDQRIPLPTASLNTGVYLLQVRVGNQVSQHKLLVH